MTAILRTMWVLARKELKLLVRDWRAAILLLVMPLLFIFVLGLLLGEGFGQKRDDLLRVSIVDLDSGLKDGAKLIGGKSWFDVVKRDLAETGGIKIEMINSADEARDLVRNHKRAAVLIFHPGFSAKMAQCSFLVDGLNPFHRDGVHLNLIDVEIERDDKQPGQAAMIEQLAQVTLLRVILPWMIGRAFERLSEEKFIDLLCNEVYLPVPLQFRLVVKTDKEGKASLQELLKVAYGNKPDVMSDYKQRVGKRVQSSLQTQFEKYNLLAKTWAALTKSREEAAHHAQVSTYAKADEGGFLRFGARRYQVLVPMYTVMFAFFLVITVGWLFVSERRQGTLKRLRVAPVRRSEILLGKLLPCFLLSLGQGGLLLLLGKLLVGMSWGPDKWPLWQQVAWLVPVVFTTSLAAMGLAVLVAAVARTEIQVAIYGALPVLVLSLMGGCVLPREWMPEQAQEIGKFTPQGWALDAYRELLDKSAADPNLHIVLTACGVLTAFGVGFALLAGWFMRLD